MPRVSSLPHSIPICPPHCLTCRPQAHLTSLEVAAADWLALCFNAVYAGLYLAFLLAYAAMAAPPRWQYVAGVLLYCLGYAAFAVQA